MLPNSPNVILAAERAAELSEKPARVVPTRSQQEGLAVAGRLRPGAGAEENAERGRGGRARRCAPAASRRAARDDAQGRFARGDAVGYAGEELVAWGDPADVAARRRCARSARTASWSPASPATARRSTRRASSGRVPDGAELDYHEGGQAAWWWLLCAE